MAAEAPFIFSQTTACSSGKSAKDKSSSPTILIWYSPSPACID
jgi:hypothetical protein